MTSKEVEKNGMTAWDVAHRWIKPTWARVVIFAFVTTCAASGLWYGIHKSAEPGSQITIAGFFTYTKQGVPAQKRVALKVSGFTGSMGFNANINDQTNKNRIWSGINLTSSTALAAVQPFGRQNFASIWLDRVFHDPKIGNGSTEWFGLAVRNAGGKEIDDQYKAAIDAWLSPISTAIAAVPSEIPPQISLQDYLKPDGNTLIFAIRPRSRAWSLTVDVIALNDKGDLASVIKRHIFSSDDENKPGSGNTPALELRTIEF